MKYIKTKVFSRFLCLIGIVTLLSVCNSAFADGEQSTYMEVDGHPGIWMPEAMSQKMLADIEELTIVRPKLKLMETQLETRADRIEDLKLAVDLSIKAEERAVDGLRIAVEAKQRAEDKAGKWYRHPAFWTAVGIVLTVVVEIVVVKVLREVGD